MNQTEHQQRSHLRLRVLLPTQEMVQAEVVKINAEAENGWFCLLPRHIDFVSALPPGVLIYETPDQQEHYIAIDSGVLVKCADEVSISTLNGVQGKALDDLEALVRERFIDLDEHERKARTALARLEAGTLKGFRQLQERAHV